MILAATTQCHKGAIISLHQGFFTVVVIYGVLMGLWGLFLFARGNGPSGSYLGAVILAGAVAGLEALLGLATLVSGHRPHEILHYVYGLVAVLTVPAAYFYGTRESSRRDSLVIGLACFFLVAIAFRAASTGCA